VHGNAENVLIRLFQFTDEEFRCEENLVLLHGAGAMWRRRGGYPSLINEWQGSLAFMHLHPLNVMDYVGPMLAAIGFVFVMARVPEPTRRTFNAGFAAGAVGVYLSVGFGGLGASLCSTRYSGRVSRPEILTLDWRRVADACSLGYSASLLGKSNMAVHANIFTGLCDLRRADLCLDLCRSSGNRHTRKSSIEAGGGETHMSDAGTSNSIQLWPFGTCGFTPRYMLGKLNPGKADIAGANSP
jgi:hypothetical protein